MILATLIQFSLLALLPIAVVANAHSAHFQRGNHHAIARRADAHMDVYKRQTYMNVKWSWYDIEESGNAGSCGRHHPNSAFTVAMSATQMNPSWCFRTILLTWGGRSAVATISDTCPVCPYGGLDLSPSLFRYFVEPRDIWQVGIIWDGNWDFTDAAPAPAPPPPSPTPTTTWQPPTTTALPPVTTTSTTSSVPPSTTSTSTSTNTGTGGSNSLVGGGSSNSTSSVNYSNGAASGLAAATGTINTVNGQRNNLLDLSQAFVRIGGVAMAGRH